MKFSIVLSSIFSPIVLLLASKIVQNLKKKEFKTCKTQCFINKLFCDIIEILAGRCSIKKFEPLFFCVRKQ